MSRTLQATVPDPRLQGFFRRPYMRLKKNNNLRVHGRFFEGVITCYVLVKCRENKQTNK